MDCPNFVAYVLVTLGLLFGLSICDRVIFRDDNEEGFSERNFLSPVKIPERLLIQMKDVHNLTEFLNRFVGRDENIYAIGDERDRNEGNDPDGIFSRRAYSGSMPQIAKAASCEPEEQVVELEKPGNGPIFLWPPCVRVRRCGGCCTSKMLTCSPVATSFYNATVLQVNYNPQTPETFESQGYRSFSLVEHDRCACMCKQQAEDCGPLQEFHENECRCVCANQQQASECTSPKKVWDSSECMCKCRQMLDCSTGSYFNPLKCRCESSRRSLEVNNLDHLNSSVSERSQDVSS